MTHEPHTPATEKVSDEALNKLDEKLASQIGDDVQVIFNHEYLFKQAREAIACLRAELAKKPCIDAEAELVEYLDGEADIEISSAQEFTELGKQLRRMETTVRRLIRERDALRAALQEKTP